MADVSKVKLNGTAYNVKDASVPSWAKQSSKPSYTQDEVGDGSTYKRVTSTEKSTWNNKGTYSKPSGGIPKSDLASAVQTSLEKADTALQSFTESDPTVPSWAKQSSKPSYTASEVGAIATSAKGAANGVASLDSAGKVPSSQLPSYVDDVLEYSAKSSFPSTGETGKIYVDTSTNKTYRWSGSAYVEISASLALGETSSTAYAGDKGKTAYNHSQTTSGNPHNVTKSDVGLGNVGNFKAVSTVASQGLSDTEKSNARANIGAGTGNGTYSKPSGGIPKTDLASAVQTSLGKADTALQSFTETDPTVPSWAKQSSKPSYTQDEIGDGTTYKRVSSTEKNTWNAKGTYSKPSGGIPKTDLASEVQTSLGLADSALQSHQTIKQDGVTGATVNRYGACNTAAATAAKTMSIKNGQFDLTAGARVSVKFTYANTASTPTLNVNSTGAKNIYSNGSQITTGSNKSLLTGTVDFVYDGTQYHLIGNYIDTNTTYSSKSAASGGTDVSLCTTGEKYTWNSKGTYSKPSGGIPKSDLASAVQTSLGKADTALQSFTESDPTVPSWAKQSSKPSYTQDEVSDGTTYKRVSATEKSTWNSKGTYSKPSGGIPKTDLASAVQTSLDRADSSYSALANVSKNIARVERNFTSTADVLSSTGCKYTTQSNKVYRITAWAEYSSTNPIAVAIVNSTNGAVFGYAEHPSTLTNVRVTATALIIGAEVVEIKAKYAGSATCAVGMIVEELSGV